MRIASRLLTSFLCAIAGFAYGYSLGFAGLLVGGAGHGILAIMAFGLEPFPFGIFNWAIIGGLYSEAKRLYARCGILLILALQYGGAIYRFTTGEDRLEHLTRTARSIPVFLALGLLWLAYGQIVIWRRVICCTRKLGRTDGGQGNEEIPITGEKSDSRSSMNSDGGRF